MNIFSNEVINVTRLHTVNRYESKEGVQKSYNVNLACYELIFNFAGKTMVSFAGRKLDNTTNSIRFLPRGVKDGEYKVECLSSGYCIDIYFDTDDEMPRNALILKNMTDIKPLYEKIYNVWRSKKSGYYSECMSIFYAIIKKIKLHSERYSSNDKTNKIIPAYEYILENYTLHNFNYKEMCSKCGMSYSYFKELFITRYGMAPVKYLTALRMEKAKELLITGMYSVNEISEKCGYDSVYYFSKVFKSFTGITPKNFRQQSSNNHNMEN